MTYSIFTQASAAQAANAAAPAATTEQAAPEAAQQPGLKDGLMGMMPFIIIIVVMFYLMYRGQKKEQKRRQEMIESVKKGDTVLTVGGIYGEIAEIHDDRFVLKIADGVKISVAKSAVSTVQNANKDTAAAAEKVEKK